MLMDDGLIGLIWCNSAERAESIIRTFTIDAKTDSRGTLCNAAQFFLIFFCEISKLRNCYHILAFHFAQKQIQKYFEAGQDLTRNGNYKRGEQKIEHWRHWAKETSQEEKNFKFFR